MSWTVFRHNLALSGSFRLLPLLQLRFCSPIQLGLSLRPQELDKPPWSWRRSRHFHLWRTSLVKRADRINSFQNRWEGFQRRLPLIIILCNPSVLRQGPPLWLGKIFQRLLFHRFEHRVTRWRVSDRYRMVYLICVSKAPVLTKSVEIDQSEGIPDPAIPGTTFC